MVDMSTGQLSDPSVRLEGFQAHRTDIAVLAGNGLELDIGGDEVEGQEGHFFLVSEGEDGTGVGVLVALVADSAVAEEHQGKDGEYERCRGGNAHY